MIAGMFGVAVLATVDSGAFHGETAAFALAYAGVRAIVVLLNARAWWHLPASRPLLNVYIPAFTASVLLFVLSAAVEPPARYWLWGIALVVDLGTPLASQDRIRQVPIHGSHIPERVGLFTIIVFGESILAVVVGTTSVSWGLESGAAAALGFAVAGALWWLYFDYVDSSIVKRTITAGQIYLYAHLPLLIGLAALGAGVKLAIKATQESGLTDEVSWIIGVGIALFMGAVAVLHLVTTQSRSDIDVWLRAGDRPSCPGPRGGRGGDRDRAGPGRHLRRAGGPDRHGARSARPAPCLGAPRDRDRLDLELDGHEVDRADAPVAHDRRGDPLADQLADHQPLEVVRRPRPASPSTATIRSSGRSPASAAGLPSTTSTTSTPPRGRARARAAAAAAASRRRCRCRRAEAALAS